MRKILICLIIMILVSSIILAEEVPKYPGDTNPMEATYVYLYDSELANTMVDVINNFNITMDKGAGTMSYNTTDFITGTAAGEFQNNNVDGQSVGNELLIDGDSTFMHWFRPKNVANPEDSNYFLYRDTGASSSTSISFGLYFDAANNNRMLLRLNNACDGSSVNSIFGFGFDNNAWYHLAFAINTSGGGCLTKLYVNGSQQEEWNCGAGVGVPRCPNLIARWGSNFPNNPRSMDGVFDDFLVFNYTLTGDEITTIFTGDYPIVEFTPPTLSNAICTSCTVETNTTSDATPSINVTCTDANSCLAVRISNDHGMTYENATSARNCTVGSGLTFICTPISNDSASVGLNTYYFWAADDQGNNHTAFNLSINITYELLELNLTLDGLNQSRKYEYNTTANITTGINLGNTVCIDIPAPGYGINYSCGVNTTNATYKITILRQDKFNDSSISIEINNGTTIGFLMDNRTDIDSVKLNITSTGSTSNITLTYYDETISFTGDLKDLYLTYNRFFRSGSEVIATNISYSSAGSESIFVNISSNPFNLSFKLTGFDVDNGNDFTFTDRFDNGTNISDESVGDYPTWTYEDFATDTRTSLYTTGSGTYNSGVDTDDERYEGDSISASTCSFSGDDKSDSDNAKMATLLLNISRFKKIVFDGSCSVSVGATVPTGCPVDNGYGRAQCGFYLTNSPTLGSSEVIPGSEIVVSATCDNEHCDNQASDSYSSNFILTRNEDSGTTFSYSVTKGGIAQGSTGSTTGDINLAYIGSTDSSCEMDNCPGCSVCPSGTGTQTSTMDTIKFTGFSPSYISNTTYQSNGSLITKTLFIAPNNISAATLTFKEFLTDDCNTTHFISNNNGTNWTLTSSEERKVFPTIGNELRYKSEINCSNPNRNPSAVYEYKLDIVSGSVENITVDLGNNDVDDFTFTGSLNASNSPISVSFSEDNLSRYVNSYTEISVTVGTPGTLQIDNLIQNSTINPVSLTNTEFETCENCEILFNFDGSNLTVSDLQSDFKGSKNITITAHTPDYSVNLTHDVQVIYSKFNYSLLYDWTTTLLFFPKSWYQLNISAYLQRLTQSVYNYTGLAYDDPMLIGAKINFDQSCIPISLSNTSEKNDGFTVNATVYQTLCNMTKDGICNGWAWADLLYKGGRVSDRDLELYLNLDFIAKDIAGNNLSVLTTGTGNVSGKVNNSLSFDGVKDLVNITFNYSGVRNLTVVGWFKKENTTSAGNHIIISNSNNNTGDGYAISYNQFDDKLYFYHGADNITTPVNTTVLSDVWYSFGMIINNNSMLKAYFNGQLIGNITISGYQIETKNNTFLGRNPDNSSGSAHFNGSIDEVKIYSKFWMDHEIEQYYNNSEGGCINPLGFYNPTVLYQSCCRDCYPCWN